MSFAVWHKGKNAKGTGITEMIDQKPVLAALARQCGIPRQLCPSSTKCPYDVTLREMIQAAMSRSPECPCSWVRKKSSFAAELDSVMDCILGKKAPLTSSILNFLRGMLTVGIIQVEEKDGEKKSPSAQKENGCSVIIEIPDEDVPASASSRKRDRKQTFPSREYDTSAHSSRKRSRPSDQNEDDLPCETPPVSPAEEEDDVVEIHPSEQEKKKRRRVRRAPWDKKRKAISGSPNAQPISSTANERGAAAAAAPSLSISRVTKQPSTVEYEEIVSSSTPPEAETRRKKQRRDEPSPVANGPSIKRGVASGRVLRSNPSVQETSLKVGKFGKKEFVGYRPDDAESATYYYVLFKNFLKSNLCDVKLRLSK